MNDIVVRTLEGLREIETARSSWAKLARTRAAHRPFAGPGFQFAALKAYHETDSPLVLVAERNGSPVGVLPLVRRPLKRFGVEVDEIGFPDNPQGILNDPLLPDDMDTAHNVAVAFLGWLNERSQSSFVLDNLVTQYPVVEAFTEAAGLLRMPVDPPTPGRTLYFTPVNGTFDDYLRTRSGDHRRQLSKLKRRAEQSGDVRVECFEGADGIREVLPEWFAVERNSWQAADSGSAMNSKDQEFHRLLLTELDSSEMGELWMTYVGRQPVSALRMLGNGNRRAVHTMHFDHRFKDLSPGILAFEAMMRDAWRREVDEVDFHGGTQFFKRWANGERHCANLRVYKSNRVGALLRMARVMSRRVRVWLPGDV